MCLEGVREEKKKILNVLLQRDCQTGVWLSCSSLPTACKFSSELGRIKSADSQGRVGFRAGLMYAARWDSRWIVMEVRDGNGASLGRMKEEELLTGERREGEGAVWKAHAAKHGGWCRTREVEGRLKRRLRQWEINFPHGRTSLSAATRAGEGDAAAWMGTNTKHAHAHT